MADYLTVSGTAGPQARLRPQKHNERAGSSRPQAGCLAQMEYLLHG